MLLLEFCLKNTYLSFKGQFYEQVEGAAMVPSQPYCVQPIHGVLRTKCSKHCPSPPRFWHRYGDDTFVIHKEANKQGFLQHINSVYSRGQQVDGSIPFLDTIVKPEVDGSLSITVYRKPIHTDQYLQWGQPPSPLSQVQCYRNPLP